MRLLAALCLLLAVSGQAQSHPRDKEIHDDDTRAWWHTTEALSGDSMEGRDTGSAAYQRAATYVAERFRKAGLKPAGSQGDYFQPVAMHEVAVAAAASSFTIERNEGSRVPLAFLEQITITPTASMATDFDAPLTFRGYCGKDAVAEIAGKIVVCFGTQRAGLPSGAERAANARAGNAAGLVTVDDTEFTIEPPRWPQAYARTVTLVDPKAAIPMASAMPIMRLNAASFPGLIEGAGQNANAILASGGHQAALPSFDIPARLHVHLQLAERNFASPNVVGLLPGSDPALKDEYLVLSAHLDGYGFGTAVAGDPLYNGALDDAAYVALLIQLAEDLRREHRTPRRSILFCAFTGEEKGLLGSNYFVDHPTVPLAKLAADINLDQLRPLFPLHLLTALALDETSLGAAATQVGAMMGIRLRPDPEPERNLLRRADHYPFLRAGVPAIGFIFGYEPGTDAERRYREWYQVRYHRPQDDLTQPIDFDAAAKFNSFFYQLAEMVANADARPAFTSGGRFEPAGK